MKTKNLIAMAMVGLALSFTPVLAQRGGGGGRSGGGHSSSSVSRSSSAGSSRSSSFSSPSRSSSSSSRSSSYSSPSRSSSSSYSPSRSSSSFSRSSSYSSPSRSSSSMPSRSSSYRSSSRNSTSAPARSSMGSPSRGGAGSASMRSEGARPSSSPSRKSVSGTTMRGGGEIPSGYVRPSSNPNVRSGGYARPGHPGALPPTHRPIHPAPYFYHPWHGYVVHCHPLFWDPLPLRPWYWPGFWLYCNSYWYDYHVTDVVVVRDYVKETYNVDMLTFGISGDVMYAIVRDGGETYLQVYDKEDHLLAEQKIHRKYCNLVIDAESGGCWISKKHEKDPLLFLWADGKLLIYEAD